MCSSDLIALTLVNQGKNALDDDMSSAAKAFEDAISALGPVALTEATSPFLVNSFFLSIGTTWPEGKDHALMVITLENTGENNMSTMINTGISMNRGGDAWIETFYWIR